MDTTKRRCVAMGFIAVVCAAVLAVAASAWQCETAYASDDSLAIGAQATVTTVPTGSKGTNVKNRANTQTVYRFGWVDGANYRDTSATSSSYDITGDGYADTIKVIATKSRSFSGYAKKLRVWINGKKVSNFTNSARGMDRIAVRVITLKNNVPYLYIDSMSYLGRAKQELYRYKGGKLKKQIAASHVSKKNTYRRYIGSLRPSGNTVKVTFVLTATVTGITKANYTYAYKSGSLKRTSNQADSFSYVTGNRGGFTRARLTAAGKFNAYTNTSLNKKAFTVKVGKKVQPLAVRLKGDNLLYKLRVSGKEGWIKCPKIKKSKSTSPDTLFYETYGKVKMSSTPLKYSSTTYWGPGTLQKLDNHALFITRNEIYARHGRQFANRELAQRFMSSSWYYPRTYMTSLTDADSWNVSLILDIEQNRQSPYV